MPVGTNPPDPDLPQSVFDALSPMAYDSTAQAFDDSGTLHWLFVEQQSPTQPERTRWFYGTSSEGENNPIALIPQLTYTVFNSGTYVASSGTITHEGKTYRIRLERNPNTGVQLAKAVES